MIYTEWFHSNMPLQRLCVYIRQSISYQLLSSVDSTIPGLSLTILFHGQRHTYFYFSFNYLSILQRWVYLYIDSIIEYFYRKRCYFYFYWFDEVTAQLSEVFLNHHEYKWKQSWWVITLIYCACSMCPGVLFNRRWFSHCENNCVNLTFLKIEIN